MSRLPNEFKSGHPLSTKGNLQPGTGDSRYACADSEAYSQTPPTPGDMTRQRNQMGRDGSPGEGALPYIPAGTK